MFDFVVIGWLFTFGIDVLVNSVDLYSSLVVYVIV